jgi:hypothetical protein
MNESTISPLLRISLRANAAFSATCGVTLLVASDTLASLFGVPDPTLLGGLGLNLVVFAAALVFLASRETIRRPLAMAVVWLDLAWVAGSVPVLLAAGLSSAGNWAVVIVMDVVLTFAVLQYLGIRRMAPARAAMA